MLCGITAAAWASGIDFPTYQPRHTEREEEREYLDMGQKEATTFSSTSIERNGQSTREYFVPVSALTVTGGVTTEDGGSEDSDSGRPGVRRIGHNPGGTADPAEPKPIVPLGNIPWLLMVMLALGYVAIRTYRTRNSGLQE